MRSERTRRRLLAIGLVAFASSVVACGPAPNLVEHPRRARAVRVVPADQVKGTCRCDDDDDLVADDEVPRQKPIEYVKLRDWQPPPQVEELEASLPARGPGPQSFTQLPPLTLHQRIVNTSLSRWSRGNVHAR